MSQTERCDRRDKRRNLERVLQAAHALIAEHGSAVTMEEVAKRAGVGVGTIYRRFPSKEHLLAAVSGAACQGAHDQLAAAASLVSDPVERLRVIVATLDQQRCLQSHLLAYRHDNAENSCVDRPPTADLYAVLAELVHNVIVEGQQQGRFRCADPTVLTAICLEILSPEALQRVQRAIGESPVNVASEVADLLLEGLLHETVRCKA